MGQKIGGVNGNALDFQVFIVKSNFLIVNSAYSDITLNYMLT